MKFCYGKVDVMLKGLIAVQMIEEGSLNMLNKSKTKGVILHLLEGDEGLE